MPEFSVVICAYTLDRWEELLTASAAVQAQTRPPREVIVVVDHNRALWQRARWHLPDVKVLENEEAQGLSGARNTGIRAAHGELVAFIDEDAVAASDWLDQLGQGYGDEATGEASGATRVLGVGGAIVPWWLTGRPRWFPEEFDWVVGCTYRGMPLSIAPVRNLIGCNMSFRREIFSTLGGFRDGIGRIGTHPAGCEETELCLRARQQWPQARLIYQPRARVAHRVPGARANWRYFGARCYFEGRSKALVTALAGSRAGLASERAYTLHTLPQGVGRGLLDAARHGQLAGLARAGAIAAGLAITTTGYVTGRLLTAAQGRKRLKSAPAACIEQRGHLPADVQQP